MRKLKGELSGKVNVWYEEGSAFDKMIKQAWTKNPYPLTVKTLNKTDDWAIYCMNGRDEKLKVCFSQKLRTLREMSVGEFFSTN